MGGDLSLRAWGARVEEVCLGHGAGGTDLDAPDAQRSYSHLVAVNRRGLGNERTTRGKDAPSAPVSRAYRPNLTQADSTRR